MRKILLIIILFSIAIDVRSQNVVQSATLIESFKDSVRLYEPLFSEISLYTDSLKGKSTLALNDKINFNSKFLKNYYRKLIFKRDSFLNKITIASLSVVISSFTNTYKATAPSTLTNIPSLLQWINSVPIQTTVIDGIVKTNGDTIIIGGKPFSKKTVTDSLNSWITFIKIPSKENMSKQIGNKKTLTDLTKSIVAQKKFNLQPSLNFEIQNVTNTIKSSLPSESTAADALAIFIANRVKEETVLAFVDLLNNNLGKIQPLPCLFKNTIREISGYSQGQSARFGTIVKKAIAADLIDLPESILSCNLCKDAELSKLQHFTQFFEDITEGVDLINNVDYYADKIHDTDTKFISSLRLFKTINTYFSFLHDSSSENTWVDPKFINPKNSDVLKLALALVYEKEKPQFDEFIKNRYGIADFDLFLNDTIQFKTFKENFKELFFRLHRLESYWQIHKQDGRSIVDMEVYEEKIQDVFRYLYYLLKYDENQFPLKNEKYKMYLKAKEAVGGKDLEGIVFHSQKLLDLLNCYEIKLPHIKLPALNFKWENNLCKDTARLSARDFAKLNGDSVIKISELRSLHNILMNQSSMSVLMKAILCEGRQPKFTIFKWSFIKNRKKFYHYDSCGDFNSAMAIRFRPWTHPFTFVFAHKTWRLGWQLNNIRKIHIRQIELEASGNFRCYFENQNSFSNRVLYNSSRKDVSLLFNFFTDISKAKNSKQLSEVIAEYAEPPQSYKIKRYNKFSCDLNAFAGVYAGAETKAGHNLINKGKPDSLTRLVTGFTAPVGLTLSWGGRIPFRCENTTRYPSFINRKGKIKSLRGGCISATFVGIDIGAVVSYRFSHDDATQALPKDVTFEQMLAPGFYLGYGFPGLPLMLSGGIQYTPMLRTFDQQSDKLFDTYRVGFSVAYDIPLLNIGNTTKRTQRKKK